MCAVDKLTCAGNLENLAPVVKSDRFKFHHISTDEMYGDLNVPEDFFRKTTLYAPSSTHSTNKASSDLPGARAETHLRTPDRGHELFEQQGRPVAGVPS